MDTRALKLIIIIKDIILLRACPMEGDDSARRQFAQENSQAGKRLVVSAQSTRANMLSLVD